MTGRDTVTATANIARHAVAKFGLEQGLSRPIGIRRPSPEGLLVDLAADDLQRWIDATGADYLGTETLSYEGSCYARVSFTGKVPSPIGDVAVVIRIVQRVHNRARLALVPDGAA